MSQELTESLEDYLEAISHLQEEFKVARVKDISSRLNVKMPSVTCALRQLAVRGYLDYEPNMPVLLTPQGRCLAEKVLKKHRILHHFFQSILLLPPGAANRLACRVEHEMDERAIFAVQILIHAIESRSDCMELRCYLRERLTGTQSVPDKTIVNRETGV